jgi:hypothetical protein
MKRSLVDRRWVHYLDLEYWNDGHLPTYAREVEISPIKTLWTNGKGRKEKELSPNKVYRAIELYHLVNDDRYSREEFNYKRFSRYILLNDKGELMEYFEKGAFITKENRRDKILNKLLK